ncbi:hypothetical protein [Acidobacterium sp. S8]|uniref:hypothetical protein n=1 Tax=Acidobacterium sp. S8 TaxID=1641854 RepID=UPI00157670CA|nr:hypothetical protein [Acidobacterium sp. S8]
MSPVCETRVTVEKSGLLNTSTWTTSPGEIGASVNPGAEVAADPEPVADDLEGAIACDSPEVTTGPDIWAAERTGATKTAITNAITNKWRSTT